MTDTQDPTESGTPLFQSPPKWQRVIWVPALAIATGLMGVSVAFALRPTAAAEGVWSAFVPEARWTPTIIVGAWALGLILFAWPRRHQRRPFLVTTITGLAALAIIGGLASFIPRSGVSDPILTPVWRTLRLFTGDPIDPLWDSGPDGQLVPVALQVARFAAITATFSTALVAALVLWRQQYTRVRMRFAFFSDLVVGIDGPALEMVRRLAADPARDLDKPIGVVHSSGTPVDVVHELSTMGLLATELDLTDPAAGPALFRLITRPVWYEPRTWIQRRGLPRPVAVDRIYVVGEESSEARQLTEILEGLMRHVRTTKGRAHVQVVVRTSDLDEAQSLRQDFLETAPGTATDAISPVEVTATETVGRVLVDMGVDGTASSDVTLALCGDTPLSQAVLLEIERRVREQRYLSEAEARYWRESSVERRGQDPGDLVTRPFAITRVILVDPNAAGILRQHHLSRHSGDGPNYEAVAKDWRQAESDLQRLGHREGETFAVIVTTDPEPSSRQVASRLAASGIRTWYNGGALSRGYRSSSQPNLHEFPETILFAGWLPESTWTRIARVKHEYYRRRHFPAPQHEVKATRLPWWHREDDRRLPREKRDDNVDQVRGVMAAVQHSGYQWRTGLDLPPESGFRGCLFELAEREHERWRVNPNNCPDGLDVEDCSGERTGTVRGLCLPWHCLPPKQQLHNAADLESVLKALTVFGLTPVRATDRLARRDRETTACNGSLDCAHRPTGH